MKVVEKNGLRVRDYPAVFEEQAVARDVARGGRDGSGCGSPGLVPLMGSFEDSDNFYMLTEYHPRGDLMKVIKGDGAVPVPQARMWCAELLVALEQLHEQRIVHRDVKPDNILIDEEGHVALTDFGIARGFGVTDEDRPWTRLSPWNTPQIPQGDEDGPEAGADETCSLVGTPGYTAPEVYSGRYSYPADVWGAGVVLHSMITGELPFGLLPQEQRLEELITRTDTLPVDFGLPDWVDGEARDLLAKMMEKDPAKRPSIPRLKTHPWFRDINWTALQGGERGEASSFAQDINEDEEDVYIAYGRPYCVFDLPPHEWFEWVSPRLRSQEDSFDPTDEWFLGDREPTQSEVGGERVLERKTSKRSGVVQKMRRWFKRRMSFSR
ncbi:kinase-like domain-containing protein [Daedaleopsis nitida]|nr:kinase-like domain-containing protein [Daedaleopsis nitida]